MGEAEQDNLNQLIEQPTLEQLLLTERMERILAQAESASNVINAPRTPTSPLTVLEASPDPLATQEVTKGFQKRLDVNNHTESNGKIFIKAEDMNWDSSSDSEF